MGWINATSGRWNRAWLNAILFASLTFAAGAQAAPPAASAPGFRTVAASSGGSKALIHASEGGGSGNGIGRDLGVGKRPEIEVDPNLVRQLSAGNRRDFAIEFAERPDLSAAYGMDWQARGRYVVQRLQRAAERSQAEVAAHLRASGVRFHSYYAKNVILVRGGDYRTMQDVLTFEGIERVRIPPRMGLILPGEIARGKGEKSIARPRDTRTKTLGSNIEWVQADDVWAMGFTGEGTVVGSIDSGVRYDHEALVQQYRGNLGGGNFDHDYHWLDPEGGSPFPAPASSAIDDQHGTHTTGTMVGDDHDPVEANRDRVGMAPDAKWIACQGFPASGSVDAALLACGQFMLAPTDLEGNDAEPDLRPMAVNNSWGSCPEDGALDDFYDDVVEAWNAAGIMPVFSNGNASNCGYPEPPGLATVGSPGNSPFVFGIGSTGNSNGQYAVHSNWGPTQGINPGLPDYPDHGGYPQLKPNVVSPGEDIRSTIGTSTTSYDSAGWSGTSMSAPHVTGLMALMFEAAPCLVGDFGTVGTLIQQTARPIDYDSGGLPGVLGPGPGNIPNFATGWGEIDALDAVNAAIEECGPQAFIAGQVTVEGTGAPVAGALVEIFVDENVRIYSTVSGADGSYLRRVPVPGPGETYTVRASLYGYLTETATNVAVVEEQTTTQNLVLEVADTFTVSGVVTDAATGWPLHARIAIDGYPQSPVWTDPVTGAYSVDLVEGTEFAFATTATAPGYVADARDVGPLTADIVVDIALAADLVACNAPGYNSTIALTQDFESGTPPAGWSETNLGTSGNAGWLFGTNFASTEFPIPAHTRYAASNDDRCGSSAAGCNGSEDYLFSPTFSLVGATTPSLRFDSFFTGAWGQTAAVEYSIDGGTVWNPVGVPAEDTDWGTENLSLAAASGQANVRLRFHSDDNGDWASGWAIDNVQVSSGCVVPATGGLIAGRVLDANTGAGLNGAVVSVAGGGTVGSAAVEDSAIGDGFYTVYAPSGSPMVTASPGTLPAGYAADSANVVVVDGQVTDQDFELEAGMLQFSPASGPAATIPFGTTSLQNLGVTNAGGVTANYTVLAEVLAEDFEDGVPPPAWTSQNAGATSCPWLTNVDYELPNHAGGQGFSAAVSSDACGSGSSVDARLLSPVFDFTAVDLARVEFMLAYRHLGTSRFDVEVSTNGGASWATAFTQNTSTSPTGPGTRVSVDLTPYAGNVAVQLRLRYRSGWDWYVQVDRLRVLTDSSPLPWLGFADILGTLAPAASGSHPVQFRADRVSQPGEYTAALSVVEDTPYAPPALTAALTATAPASFGTIAGTVTTQGYCDADPAPLAGATVSIQGTGGVSQTTTDDDGNYSWQIDSTQAPFTVTVSAPGQIATSATGIALSPGGNADVDLEPRAALPCFDVVEDSLAATLEQGDAATRVLNLANTGAAAVDPWQVTVGASSDTMADVTLTQSLSHTILDGNSIACGSNNITAANSYLRVYHPAAEGFVGDVTIESIGFAVETAEEGTGGGEQEVEVAVYALNGPIEDLDVALLGVQTYTVTDGDLTDHTVTLSTPIVVPASQRLLIELFSGDNNNTFYPGTNDGGETAPAYLFAPDCGISTPTSYADVGFPAIHLILDVGVNGAKVCGSGITPVDWLALSDNDGSLAPGASEPLDVEFDAAGKSVGSYNAALCVTAADPQTGLLPIPAAMTVLQDVPDMDLSIAVNDSADPAVAGTALTYTVDVANAGPAASGVSVTATLDAGLAYEGFAGTGWTCVEAAGVVSCTLAGTVGAGASAAALSIETTPIVAGTRSSVFTVAGTENDLSAANDSDTETTAVTAAPSVDVTLNASIEPASVMQGVQARLRIIAANVGADDASGVEVAIDLPAGIEYASAVGSGWSCVAGSGSVVCTFAGTLDQGFAPTLDVMLATPAAGTVEIDATIAAAQADSNAANNSATVQLTVTPASETVFGDGFED